MKKNNHLIEYFEYNQTQAKLKQQKQPPNNNRPKQLLLQASSYLSIGQYIKFCMDSGAFALMIHNLFVQTSKFYTR